MSGHPCLSGAEVRARVGHPVIDGDAHIVECLFAFDDFLKAVGGPEIVRRWNERLRGTPYFRTRSIWWGAPSGPHTGDRAMALLPKYFAARMADCGIDFAHVLTTQGLNIAWIRDDELRRAACRALNVMYAELFDGLGAKLRPVAVIPAFTAAEAIAELEHCVEVLGYKAAMIGTEIYRPWPEVARDAPQLAPYAEQIRSIAMDPPEDFDPFWQRCVDLRIAPLCHTPGLGAGYRQSPSNYVFNHLGMFASGSEFFCRALVLGGVTRRFPALDFGFLECGIGWALQLLGDLAGHFEKRNPAALRAHLDPATLDVALLGELFDRYGDRHLTGERIRANPHHRLAQPTPPDPFDEFAAAGMTRVADLAPLFCDRFYFGCEPDDRMLAAAFDPRFTPPGMRLKPVFGSDIGHWDVVDAQTAVGEAWRLVEDGAIDEAAFRDFTFTHAAQLHLRANPDYFAGTAVESAVAPLRAGGARP